MSDLVGTINEKLNALEAQQRAERAEQRKERARLMHELGMLRNLRQIAIRQQAAIDRQDTGEIIQADTELAQALDEIEREFPT